MAVKIRLARRGRKKLARFDVVVTDSRSPRDGRFIEKIGTYNPLTNPATIELNEEKAFDWLMKGAQPSEVVKAMLSYRGIMFKKHLQIGVVKGAINQETADKKLADWKQTKETKIQSKRDNLAKSKQDAAKARKDAETKVREARAEAIRKKQEAAAAAATAAPAEGEAAPATETQA
jgi:small subunit ribosomal protein S16